MPHNTEHRHSGAHYGRHIVAIISAVFVAVSCSGPSLSPNPTNPTISDRPQPPTGVPATPAATQTATPAATQTATPVASTGPSARPPSEHRIGVRTVGGAGEFFDRETNQRFTPRGANLVRLAGWHHSTLDPAFYDPAQLAIALERMASGGYNVARVFLNHDRGGLSGSSTGLSAAYMDNVDDFLRLARASDMFVIFTQDWLPEGESYAFEPDPLIDNVNLLYLSAGGVEANARYFHDFAAALIERQAPLDALLAYELRNELYLTESYAPFSLSSGHVGTANGRTYDLASGVERQQLMEQGVVFWVDRMRAAIRDVDPTALVTVGFFQPKGPNPTRADDDRIIETGEVIASSEADFIDLHPYPGFDLNLRQFVENFGLPAVTSKPILLGEFGAFRAAYPTVADATRVLVEWQIESCSYGFDGWLQWTWDTLEQPEFWNATDEGGVLASALSPATRPDPCTVGPLDLPLELAGDAQASASSSLPDGRPALANDGLAATSWNSGDDAPQWIELDLGSVRTISGIRLLVGQYPAGRTTHRVLARGGGGALRLLATLRGTTTDGDWLEVPFDSPVRARYVRVETTESPSWVAWREISIFGAAD